MNKIVKNSIFKVTDPFKAFSIFINSLKLNQIKDIAKLYNSEIDDKSKRIQKATSLKKRELVDALLATIPKSFYGNAFELFNEELKDSLISNSLAIITEEHSNEKILNTTLIANGKGIQVWYKGRGWIERTKAFKIEDEEKSVSNANSANLEISNFSFNCSCKFGRYGGFCAHMLGCLFILHSKDYLRLEEIPLSLSNEEITRIQKRIEAHTKQSIFNSEASIVLEEDYYVYLYQNFITLKWGGKFPGKTTKNIDELDTSIDDFLSKKISDVMVRKIKVKTGEGYPIKILTDSYGIIPKILEREKLVKKILRKFNSLNDPNLPNNKEELEQYLKSSLRDNVLELDLEPPFDAYLGNESYCFVSYTHSDKIKVYPILRQLNELGVRIWYDEGIPLSVDWEKFIFDRLKNSSVVLGFISSEVLKSKNTQKELKKTIEWNKKFIGIYLEPVILSDELDFLLKFQGLMKHELSDERFYKELRENLREVLNK